MGVWDFLNNVVSTTASTISQFNPFSAGLSLMRMVIGAILVLILIIIGSVWLFKDSDKKEGAKFRWRN